MLSKILASLFRGESTTLPTIPSITTAAAASPLPVNPEIREINDLDSLRTFLLASPLPTIVKIGADWCGPCRNVDKYLPELARQYAGRITFIKVDSDAAPDIRQHFQVTGLPTFKFFNAKSDSPITGNRMLDKPNTIDKHSFGRLIEDHFLAALTAPTEDGELDTRQSTVVELHKGTPLAPNPRARAFFNLSGV